MDTADDLAAVRLAKADGDLDGVEVQRVDDGLDALADHGAGGLVHLDGVGLRHLLDGYDNSHCQAPGLKQFRLT